MVAIVQHASKGTTGSASLSLTLGADTTAENCLNVLTTQDVSTNLPTGVTIGGSADNFEQDADYVLSGSFALAAWSDPGCEGGQTAVAVSWASSVSGGLTADVFEVSGLRVSPRPYDVSAGTGNTSGETSFNSGSVSTNEPSELWLGAAVTFTSSGHTTLAANSPWTAESQIATGSKTDTLCAYQIVSSTGSAGYSGTSTETTEWAALVATYVAAGTTLTATASLTGAGSVAAAAVQDAGTTTLTGQGGVGTPDLTQGAAATLAGAGQVAPAAVQEAAATAAGAGAVSAAAAEEAGATLAGAGAATTGVTLGAGAPLAGQGTLAAAAALEPTAALAGTGQVGAPGAEAAATMLAGAGYLAEPSSALAAGATLTGQSQLGPSDSTLGASAVLAALGAVTAAPPASVPVPGTARAGTFPVATAQAGIYPVATAQAGTYPLAGS